MLQHVPRSCRVQRSPAACNSAVSLSKPATEPRAQKAQVAAPSMATRPRQTRQQPGSLGSKRQPSMSRPSSAPAPNMPTPCRSGHPASQQVVVLLTELGMARYANLIVARGFDDINKLRFVQEVDLLTLGIPSGYIIKLRRRARACEGMVSPPPRPAVTGPPVLLGSRPISASNLSKPELPLQPPVDCISEPDVSEAFADTTPKAQQILTVQRSWQHVKAFGYEEVGELMYRHLFEQAPAAKAFFPLEVRAKYQSWEVDEATVGDDLINFPALRMVCGKIVAVVGQCVTGLHNPQMLAPKLRLVALRHVNYGAIDQARFEILGSVLMNTLRIVIGEDFTPEVEFAWSMTYKFFSAIMLAGISEAKDLAAQAKNAIKEVMQETASGASTTSLSSKSGSSRSSPSGSD
eukprot:TRINITY_DN10248_c0_g1_i1.p1 TRINITY_DN10248_c0_g1~~TRINITY_DN10248_c0_g1_i1.p1  ORF type:complete len:406 (-),score=79.63 TRINITY_DN10248_c0_g1_i1:106-1323(-)